MRVDVVYCPAPGLFDDSSVDLADGATLADALAASGVVERHALDAAALRCGVWGRVQRSDTVLRDGDRVEVYRPLQVDPKAARRLRSQQQSRSTRGQRAASLRRRSPRDAAAAPAAPADTADHVADDATGSIAG